jgi:hypothetical protein
VTSDVPNYPRLPVAAGPSLHHDLLDPGWTSLGIIVVFIPGGREKQALSMSQHEVGGSIRRGPRSKEQGMRTENGTAAVTVAGTPGWNQPPRNYIGF